MSQEGGSGNTFKKESGFIWSVLGSAIGFANILAFSAQCYKNGGGAFLIPLLCAYLLLGIPLLVLEAVIGHKFQLPYVSAYGRAMGRPGSTMGWMSILTCATIGSFYTVLTAFAVAYVYFSLTMQVPADTAFFFKYQFLHDSGSLADWGGISWGMLVSAMAVTYVTWWTLTKNVQKGIERVSSIFMPALVALIGVFALVSAFLPGALTGIKLFLIPDFSRLAEFAIWRDAFGHLFFSLSLGLGIITGYARYSGKNVQVGRAMRWVVFGDIIISFIAGLVIFSCLGFLSHDAGVPFAEIVKTDSTFELGYILFPKVLQAMGPWAMPVLGSLFFFCLFVAGITGVFSIAESVAGNVQAELGVTRRQAVAGATLLIFAGSCFFCAGNGQHVLGALAPMVLGFNMLVAGMVEVIVFVFIVKGVQREITHQLGVPSGRWTKVFGALSLGILAIIFTGAVLEEMSATWSLAMGLRWTWFAVALAASAVLSGYSKHSHAQEFLQAHH